MDVEDYQEMKQLIVQQIEEKLLMTVDRLELVFYKTSAS